MPDIKSSSTTAPVLSGSQSQSCAEQRARSSRNPRNDICDKRRDYTDCDAHMASGTDRNKSKALVGDFMGCAPGAEGDEVVLNFHVREGEGQRGRAADDLALEVVLGAVARALELVLVLRDSKQPVSPRPPHCVHRRFGTQPVKNSSKVYGLRLKIGSAMAEALRTVSHGTTQPRCVHTAFRPNFSSSILSLTIRYVASACAQHTASCNGFRAPNFVKQKQTDGCFAAHLEALCQAVVARLVGRQPLGRLHIVAERVLGHHATAGGARAAKPCEFDRTGCVQHAMI